MSDNPIVKLAHSEIDLSKRTDCGLVGRMAGMGGLSEDKVRELIARGMQLATTAQTRNYIALMKMLARLAEVDASMRRQTQPSQHVHLHGSATEIARELSEE